MKYFSITGQMRSGTSLISDFLHRQPGCKTFTDQVRLEVARNVAFPEDPPNFADELPMVDRLKLFQQLINVTLWPSRQDQDALAMKRIQPFRHCLLRVRSNPKRRLHIEAEDVLDLPNFRSAYDLFKVFLQFNLTLGEKKRKVTIVGNKATRSEAFVENSNDNGILGVMIIRDPRAVITSLEEKVRTDRQFGVSTGVDEAIELWRGTCQTFLKGGRFHRVRFEDFVRNTEEESARLADYLGIPVDHKVEIASKNSSFGDVSAGGVREHAADRWRTVGDKAALAHITDSLRDEILAMGYEP